MESCYNHLNSKQKQDGGPFQPYYQKVDEETVENVKTVIKNHLKEGLEKDLLNKDEFNAMDPRDKTGAKFYEIFKVHKQHLEGETPPERPIISGSGSLTENIGLFVQTSLDKKD